MQCSYQLPRIPLNLTSTPNPDILSSMDTSNRLCNLWSRTVGLALILALALPLSACVSNRGDIPDAAPKSEARSRYGNPSSYVVFGKRYHVLDSAKGYNKTGYASWYGTKFHGQHTSSREPYNMFSMTAASPTLPIPTYVRVTNLENNRSVVVKVNDRGPFKSNRIIDLSFAAAKKLGYTDKGTTLVRVTAIDTGNKHSFFASNDQPTSLPLPAPVSAPTPQHKTSPKSSSHTHVQLAANSTKNTLYLQIGAFKTRSKAEHISKQIGALTSADVSVKTSHQNNKTIYRVHIGPLANNTQTDKIKQLLQQHGFEKPVAVTG